jgi:hypothetical protein
MAQKKKLRRSKAAVQSYVEGVIRRQGLTKIEEAPEHAIRFLEREARGEFKYVVRASWVRTRKGKQKEETPVRYSRRKSDGSFNTETRKGGFEYRRSLLYVDSIEDAEKKLRAINKNFIKSKYSKMDFSVRLFTGKPVDPRRHDAYRGKTRAGEMTTKAIRQGSTSKFTKKGKRRKND